MAQVTLNKKSFARLLKKLDTLKAPVDKRAADSIGQTVVREMKRDIAATRSPIAGRGSFRALQEPYRTRKANLGKGDKPNLELSGDFLASLVYQSNPRRDGFSTTIKFSNDLSRKKELGHRQGANGQHERPIIPQGDEGFNRRITNAVLEIYDHRVRDIIKK